MTYRYEGATNVAPSFANGATTIARTSERGIETELLLSSGSCMPAMRNSTAPPPEPAFELRKNLATNLKKARLDSGLTQRQLAALSGVSRDYIGQMENGTANVTIDTLNTIANHLNASPLALLTEQKIQSE